MKNYNLILLTGVSGSGKSTALSALEDLGYFCVENLPARLVLPFSEEIIRKAKEQGSNDNIRYALLVDCRDDESFPDVNIARDSLIKEGLSVGLIFLDCTDDIVIRRFRETRRKHPILHKDSQCKSITEAIVIERELLKDFRNEASQIIDTSVTSVHDLRRMIEAFLEARKSILITMQSFGFKYGNPADVDLLFDVRFLPNPYFVPELKEQTGLSTPVRDFVSREPASLEFVSKVTDLLLYLIPKYEIEGKHYLSVGIGCTGGKHRSVVIAEELAVILKKKSFSVQTFHRDIERNKNL
jgi:UPF0042 nucleotide-binding protein